MPRFITFPFRLFRRFLATTVALARFVHRLPALYDSILFQQTRQLQLAHPNPLIKYRRKCFSQADESGITLEILNRIKALETGVFAESGVRDGTENSTLILAALGWKGFWVGGEDFAFDPNRGNCETFVFLKNWNTFRKHS